MCGRFTLRQAPNLIIEQLKLEFPEIVPRFNVAPTQLAAVVRARSRTVGADTTQSQTVVSSSACPYEVVALKWGLVPSWADDPSLGSRLINGRSETVATKPAFRAAFKQRRCLVPVDGYYEWQAAGAVKQPYLFHQPDESDFAVGGLWESWRAAEGEPTLETFCLLTTEANPQVAAYHDRMPVMISPADFAQWLSPQPLDPATAVRLLAPNPAPLQIDAVSRTVNNARHEGPDCIAPDRSRLF